MLLLTLINGILLVAPPSPSPARAQGATATPHLSTEQWREDLQFLARELPKRHANAFHHVSKAQFEDEVRALDTRLRDLNRDEIVVGFVRLASLIGDGHTHVRWLDRAPFPLRLGRFGAEYRVTEVAAGAERALGTTVLKIGNVSIARAREILLPLTPQDETPWLAEGVIQALLTLGGPLHGSGVIPDRAKARYTFRDDAGQEFSMELHALAVDAKPAWTPAYKQSPLFRQRPDERFWYTYLADARTVYCNFRSYERLGKEAPGLLKLVAEKHPDKLVIDLRQNGGGDYFEGLRHLVRPIKALSDINRKGHLFILIGPNTFSAAMSNAAHFRARTAALLVGEPIGEKPNSYQESRRMTLPKSHLTVGYSVRFYRFVDQGENAIRPDQEIVPTWADFKAGRDPVLEWVLKYKS